MAHEEVETSNEIIIHASTITITTTGNQQEQSNKQLHSSILTRIHAGFFRISLSFSTQALLWKTLISEPTTIDSQDSWHVFHNLPSTAFLLLWWLALVIQVFLCLLYLLRCIFYLNKVREESLHFIGVSYLYSPWISWLLLLQSSPLHVLKAAPSYSVLFGIFSIPVVILDVKIYGQWFTTKKRFLSTIANPTSQISVIANLVVARAAAEMGWKESATFMFSLGMVHYLVLFVTLYQRLSGGNHFPTLLRPTFFLFFAAPSVASLAWSCISGSFDTLSKMLFFLSLFLFTSLASRPVLFKKSMKRFNVVWWAYSFTLTFLALVSAEYAKVVKSSVASGLMLFLSVLSVLVFLALMVLTAFNTDTLLRQNDPALTCQ